MKIMARSIQEFSAKFKPLLEDDRLFYGLLIVLIAIVSFGLGRLSGAQNSPYFDENRSIVLQAGAAGAMAASTSPYENSAVDTKEGEGMYVGSRNGTKYHLPWCPGASQIKEANKVFFSSKNEAEEAGYTPASNCKGI